MAISITRTMVEKALSKRTPYPLKMWRFNPDGSITAINAIGQKFILAVETIRLDDLIDAPKARKKRRS